MEEKVKRLLNWAEGKKSYPLTLELNITNRCNLKCRMCWLRATKPNYRQEMSDKMLMKIVDEAIKLNVQEFRFPGSGEPLTRKNILFRLMKKIKENNRSGLLISNGTLFDEKDVKSLIEIGWDVLTISIDGPDAKTNDYIRGVKGAFKRTIRTLEWIKKWKKKLRKSNPWLRMNVVLTNKNYDKLEKMVELGDTFGFKEILLQPMTVFSKEGEKLNIEESKRKCVDEHLLAANRIAKKLGIKTNLELFVGNKIVEMTDRMDELIKEEIRKFNNSFLATPCFEPFYNLIITPTGEIAPCAISGGNTGVNVKNSSLKEIWFGKYFTKIRERLLNKKLFPFCSHCCVPIFLENKRLRRELAKVIR